MGKPFWETTALAAMSREQWESLCDGCALCCLQKLEDEDTGELFYTDLACRLLDLESTRCQDYQHRSKRVKDCLILTADEPGALAWLPRSCRLQCVPLDRLQPVQLAPQTAQRCLSAHD